MIQLKVYNNTDKDEQYFLDLYETEPIKLTLSIEDITNTDATSTYSKTFKVPGTRANAQFFKNVFDVDSTMYDVTLKKPAEILVDGAEFKTGHVRLQKVFLNTELDRYDYELLFLGETRDISSIIGDKEMCQLVMTDFSWTGLPVAYTNASDFSGPYVQQDIEDSWQAFPESPSLTAGFADGDILFPLIDHGNFYTGTTPDAGVIELQNVSGSGFTHNANSGLTPERFKPMFRAKRVFDQIFQDAGYTYKSDFLNSDRFKQQYVSAFGNIETNTQAIGQSTVTSFQAEENTDIQAATWDNATTICNLYTNDVVYNPGGAFSTGTTTCSGGSYFVAPGTNSTLNYYKFDGSADVFAYYEGPSGNRLIVPTRLELFNQTQGTILDNGAFIGNGNSSFSFDSRTLPAGSIAAGDIIKIRAVFSWLNAQIDVTRVTNVIWNCTASPSDYYAPGDLDCDYKQIDYIKDILTAFRLVLSPSSSVPNQFIIEPWQEYVNSGDVHDWSKKLVENKDFVVEPLFNTQSNEIDFSMQADGDFINNFHIKNYKNPYGYLEFDANNELLKGKRSIKLNGIAPTPVEQISQNNTAAHADPTFIIPLLHIFTNNSTGGGTQVLPIKAKTRLLFYNGLKPIADNTDRWYFFGVNTKVAVFPQVTPYESFPPVSGSLNLNWYNDIRYYLNPLPGLAYYRSGSSLYSNYWSKYINSLYNKYSRRVTAYFVLNNVDLSDFSFDDTIFVNGTYYRPEKINNVQIGDRTEVQVQLITANDFVPVTRAGIPLDPFTATTAAPVCAFGGGTITINTTGTPSFNWTLSNGMTGTELTGIPNTYGPYTFDIQNVPPGTYTVQTSDNIGRTNQAIVTVPVSTAAPITTTYIQSDPTICSYDPGPCDGSIAVTPANGLAPYTITWGDDPTITSFSRSNLCEGSYNWFVTDANGCQSGAYITKLECQNLTYQLQLCDNPTGTIIASSITPIANGQSVRVSSTFPLPIDACWEVVAQVAMTPSATITAIYQDCPTCNLDNEPFFSTADEQTGEPNPVDPCPMPNVIDVHSPITSDPATLVVGDRIYIDSLHTTAFNGESPTNQPLWYGLGTVNGSPSSIRTFEIDASGTILNISIC